MERTEGSKWKIQGQIPVSQLFLILTWLRLPGSFDREPNEIRHMKALRTLLYVARI